MKIAIVGSPGSGKSTLGRTLQEKLALPLYHLDQYFWKPGWQEPDRSEFEKIHNQLCDKDEWIIEGQAIRFFEYRIQKADVIILLEVPRYRCFYRVIKRAMNYFGREYFASAKGCPEKGLDLKFIKYIWHFPQKQKKEIQSLLRTYGTQKKVFTIQNETNRTAVIESLLKERS